jgi:tetratricopeptide (TPR) repeat protein
MISVGWLITIYDYTSSCVQCSGIYLIFVELDNYIISTNTYNVMNPLQQIISILQQMNEEDGASNLLQIFLKHSSTVQQYDELSRLFYEIRDYKNSIKSSEIMLSMTNDPNHLMAIRQNLAKVYNTINEPYEAIRYLDINIASSPNNIEYKLEKSNALFIAGEFEESQKLLHQLMYDPNIPATYLPGCKFANGPFLLDDDIFQDGLDAVLNYQHDVRKYPKINFRGPEWDGSVKIGKNVAIVAVGGIGDEVINARFTRHIRELGMNPFFITNKSELRDIFNRNGITSVSTMQDVPTDSEFCLSTHLPLLLKVTPDSVWKGPYLTPNDLYVDKWKKIFDDCGLNDGKPIIAFKWKGSTVYDNSFHRAIPLDKLDEVMTFDRDDIHFVSVQKDDFDGIEKYTKVTNFSDHLETLEDLIACVSLVDHTISSCTSAPHISAACGFKTTVLPPIITYYCWLGSIRWYGDNCTIIRQKKWKDFSHLRDITLL